VTVVFADVKDSKERLADRPSEWARRVLDAALERTMEAVHSGEIGVFAPDGCRTGTVVCEVDAEIGSIDNDTVLRLYSQNPTFGLYLTRLVVQRMLASERRLAEGEAPMGSGVSAIIPRLGSHHGHRVPSASPESS
jgi:hypothetical protein